MRERYLSVGTDEAIIALRRTEPVGDALFLVFRVSSRFRIYSCPHSTVLPTFASEYLRCSRMTESHLEVLRSLPAACAALLAISGCSARGYGGATSGESLVPAAREVSDVAPDISILKLLKKQSVI